MSLEALRTLRLRRQKLNSPVLLVVGRCPTWARSLAHVVEVREGDRPALMDLRPLIGLWVAAIVTTDARALAIAAMDAAIAAGAKPYGAVDREGVHMLIAEPTVEHERNLRRTWSRYAAVHHE